MLNIRFNDNYFSNDFGYTTAEDVDNFAQKLLERGLECRVRKVIGGTYFTGCGTTIPREEKKV
jgi:adenine C2-methylase RlmN of 23S rRNA A2503 and tRNA A37